MALTAHATNGFELVYNKSGFPANPSPYMLKPDTAFTKGMLVGIIPAGSVHAGKIEPWEAATRYDQRPVAGVMAETIKQADNPATGITYGKVHDNPLNVYRVTAIPGINGDVAVVEDGHTTTTSMKQATGFTEENRAAGGLIYFYEGPGSPATRLISSTDNTNDKLVWIGELSEKPTAATKWLMFGATNLDTTAGGIFPGSVGLAVNDDSRRVNANAAANASEQPIKVLTIYPEKLAMDVMLQGLLSS